MKCKRKMQKRRDVLTVIGMMILLAFILRMWPILLLMLIGVFFYALWMLFHMDAAPQQPVQAPLLALPPPASEESVLNTAFSVLQRRITEQVLLRYPNARWVWGVAEAEEPQERSDRPGSLGVYRKSSGSDGGEHKNSDCRPVHANGRADPCTDPTHDRRLDGKAQGQHEVAGPTGTARRANGSYWTQSAGSG